MRSLLRKSTTPSRALITAFVLVGLLFCSLLITRVAAAVSAGSTPKTGRVVSIYDRGVEKDILTKAQTVGDAIKDAGVPLDPKDAVEPAASSKISTTDFKINIYRARPVVVVDGSVREKVMTPYQTPEQIAKDAGITLYDEDKTTLNLSDNIVSEGAGLVMTIQRATPITFVQYGKTITVRTQAKTVGDMLSEKGIILAKDDTLSVPMSTPVTVGMTVELWRNGVQVLTQDEDIPFDTQQIQDADQPIGYKAVQTPGTLGKKTVSYQVEMKNGVEVSRTEIQSVTTSEPKKQIEIIGAKPTFSGGFQGALAKLRACEAGGNYANKHNPQYRGAYQYSYSTWANYDGYSDPADAPPAVQDQRAWETYQQRGWQPWPVCGASLPDIYR